jgi:hypothetical protein
MSRTETVRHVFDHGWVTPGGYICDGCNVNPPHEHKCHGRDGGPACTCKLCEEPSPEELEAFKRELGLID